MTGPTRDVRRVAVLGAGSWGTAFGKVLADAGREAVLWARRPEVAAAVNDGHRNPDYLPGVALPSLLSATTDAAAALDGADAVVLVTEWREYRDLDPVATAGLVRQQLVLDGRNVLDPPAWRAAGWTYRGMGRP